MMEDFKGKFIRHMLGSGVMHLDSEKVTQGLESLTEINSTAKTIQETNVTLFSEFRNIDRFYGFVQGGKLSEDNLFYDLNIECEPDANTEKLDEIINPRLEEINDLLTHLKTDIENTVAAIEGYNSGNKSAEELAQLVDKLTLDEDYARLNVSQENNSSNTGGTKSKSARAATYSSGATAPISSVAKVDDAPISTEHQEQLRATSSSTSSQQQSTASSTSVPKVEKEESPLKTNTSTQSSSSSSNNNVNQSTSASSNSNTSNNQSASSKNQLASDFTNGNITSTNNKTNNSKISGEVANSVKDLIANKNSKDALSESIKSDKNLDPGTLVSSISNSNISSKLPSLKPIKEDIIGNDDEKSTAAKFVPPIAGISTAAVTGFGAKLYMDDKNKDKDDKKENKYLIDFDQIDNQEQNKEENIALSKEDLLKALDK